MTETLQPAETTDEQIEQMARALNRRPAELRNKFWAAIATRADPTLGVDPEELFEALVDDYYTTAVETATSEVSA